MRTLVHRGTQRPVFKVASVKLERVVQCESILEADAVLRLDIHPGVASFAEQPVRIHYLMGQLWRSHIPDFAVLSGGQLTFVEVKFDKDVDDEVQNRSRWMETALARLGVQYRLLTEVHVRQGGAVQNALRLLRRARHAANEAQLLRTLEALRRADHQTLADFGWDVPDSAEAVCIAQLVVRGKAKVETDTPLTGASRVWFTEVVNNEEAAPW